MIEKRFKNKKGAFLFQKHDRIQDFFATGVTDI